MDRNDIDWQFGQWNCFNKWGGAKKNNALLTSDRMNRRKADFEFHYKYLEDEV